MQSVMYLIINHTVSAQYIFYSGFRMY